MSHESQDGERKSLKDFRALDAAIIAAITGGDVQFSKIRAAVWRAAAPHGNRNGELYRVIDGRLQALRRAGWIRYASRKWSVAHD